MAKISALSFANNVERNRKSLIQHCLENGKDVNEIAPLNEVVAINNEINITEGQFKVEFKDLDGNYFAPTQYVNVGESATLPNGYPELDPEYLEFVEWAISGGDSLDNVERDIICLPQYQTKYVEAYGQRPTYLICYFDSTTLSPSILMSKYTNTYIDWGDGSGAVQVSSSATTHTYSSEGFYTITVYGDSYRFGDYIFSGSSFYGVLLRAYIGNNIDTSLGSNNTLRNCYALKYAVLPNNIFNDFLPANCLNKCYAIKAFVIPKGVKTVGANAISSCSSLTDLVIPDSVNTLGNNFCGTTNVEYVSMPHTITTMSYSFGTCKRLIKVSLSKNLTEFPAQFSYCYLLKSLDIPKSIASLPNTFLQYCYTIQSVVVPENIKTIGSNCMDCCTALKSVTLPSSVVLQGGFLQCRNLQEVILGEDFDSNLTLAECPINKASLIDIANKLKDNTGNPAKTIMLSLYKCKSIMVGTYLNELGAETPKETEGAVSILEFIQNKNWTVSFSTAE